MTPVNGNCGAAIIGVHIVNGRPKNADEWALEIMPRLIHIGETAHPLIRDQAIRYRNEIFRVIRDNIALALQQEREWAMKELEK